jgi:sugar/nucleoside kinase (ribokinase family)
MSRLLVVGDVMWDVVVRPHATPAVGSDTPSSVVVTRGGAAANLAVALRAAVHFPTDVVYVGAAGADEFGQRFADDLERANVRAHLATAPERTGMLVSVVDGSGERTMLTDRGANAFLSGAVVLPELTEDLRHLHLSGYSVLDPAHHDWCRRALSWAREHGATTSVDVCSWAPLVALGPAVFLDVVTGVDLLFANQREAETLSGLEVLEDVLAWFEQRFPEVVLTLGAHGAWASHEGRRVRSDGERVDVVDTTGAGDAATGTYLGWRLSGHDLAPSLQAAMSAAQRVVTGLGSRG